MSAKKPTAKAPLKQANAPPRKAASDQDKAAKRQRAQEAVFEVFRGLETLAEFIEDTKGMSEDAAIGLAHIQHMMAQRLLAAYEVLKERDA
jgi:hypothetical protein